MSEFAIGELTGSCALLETRDTENLMIHRAALSIFHGADPLVRKSELVLDIKKIKLATDFSKYGSSALSYPSCFDIYDSLVALGEHCLSEESLSEFRGELYKILDGDKADAFYGLECFGDKKFLVGLSYLLSCLEEGLALEIARMGSIKEMFIRLKICPKVNETKADLLRALNSKNRFQTQFLIQWGGNICLSKKNLTAAVSYDWADIVELLNKRGLDFPNLRVALIGSVLEGHQDVFEYLAKKMDLSLSHPIRPLAYSISKFMKEMQSRGTLGMSDFMYVNISDESYWSLYSPEKKPEDIVHELGEMFYLGRAVRNLVNDRTEKQYSNVTAIFLAFKKMAHVSDIKGTVTLTDNRVFKLEGFWSYLFYADWVKFISSYLDIEPCARSSLIEALSFAANLNSLTEDEILERVNSSKLTILPVSINLGTGGEFKYHEIALVFYRNMMVICNSIDERASFFQIDPSRLTREHIHKIKNGDASYHFIYGCLCDSLDLKEKALEMEPPINLKIQQQFISNCSFRSSHAALTIASRLLSVTDDEGFPEKCNVGLLEMLIQDWRSFQKKKRVVMTRSMEKVLGLILDKLALQKYKLLTQTTDEMGPFKRLRS